VSDEPRIEDQLKQMMVERLFLPIDPAEIGDDDNLAEMFEVDSVKLLELIVGTEELFEISFEDDQDFDATRFATIRSIAEVIGEKLGERSLMAERIHFQVEGRRLFGTLRGPADAPAGVVFAPPFAEAKKCAYRTYVDQARRLAEAGLGEAGFGEAGFGEAGFSSLHFDYAGTGDSEGRFRDFTPSRARVEILAAAAELRRQRAPKKVGLLGLELGGSLAFEAAAKGGGADFVILWEPILRGEEFVRLNLKRHYIRSMLTEGTAAPPAESSGLVDFGGYELSVEARTQLEQLDLRQGPPWRGPLLFVQLSHRKALVKEAERFLEARVAGGQPTAACIALPPFWQRIDRVDPTPLLEVTRDWLAARFSLGNPSGRRYSEAEGDEQKPGAER